MTGMGRVLVATDLSQVSERMYTVAAEIARCMHAELVVAHVTDLEDYREMLREVRIGIDDYMEKIQSTIRSHFRKAAGPDVKIRSEVVLRKGSVASGLIDLATRRGVDLIIMGTHGRTGLPRMLLGSISEEVIRHARIPVLVVPVVRRAEEPVEATPAAHPRVSPRSG